jgi:phosphatidylglycerol lysyltransferase
VLAVFVVALTAGIISHVPGGLGVFETIILMGLSNELPGDQILAALLVFRVIYFLVPLVTACALFGSLEAIQARRRITRVSQDLAGWLAPAAPAVLAGCSFIGGAVLLFSNATPDNGTRLELVSTALRLPVIEASHFLGSVVGVFLLLLSSQLQRRSHAAWLVTLLLFLLGSIAELLNGLEWKQAVLLLVFFFVLLASRDEFYRRSALVAEPFTSGRFLAIGIVLGSTFWLGLFSYKQVDYRDELWWHFTLYGDASRFLRASVAVARDCSRGRCRPPARRRCNAVRHRQSKRPDEGCRGRRTIPRGEGEPRTARGQTHSLPPSRRQLRDVRHYPSELGRAGGSDRAFRALARSVVRASNRGC